MSEGMETKGRSIWEMASDYAREASLLIAVFGLILPHENLALKHGLVLGSFSVVCLWLGLIFEYQRDRKG